MRAALLITAAALVMVAGCSYDFDAFTPNGEAEDSAFVEDTWSSEDSSAAVDTSTPPVDSAVADTGVAADTAVVDTGAAADTAVVDTGVAVDSAVVDTGVAADTAVVDTGVAADTAVVDTGVADTATTDGAVACTDTGGKVYGGHCYFPLPVVNGDAAKTACEGRGAHLVTITTAGEQAFVAAMVPGKDRWIGLRSTATSSMASAFKWITGETSAYGNWVTGQPKNSGLCVVMRGSDDGWDDRACTDTNDTLCERE